MSPRIQEKNSRLAKTVQSASTSKVNRLQHLEMYIAAGKRIVGLNGKTPAESGWQRAPFRYLNEIPTGYWHRMEYNFGWVLDSSDFVIDIDRHSGSADGWDSFNRLIDDLYVDRIDEMTPAIVRTGGNGLHIYLSKPPRIRIRKTLPEYPGLDFCSKGQQVVAAGAIHPDTGRLYKFLRKPHHERLTKLPEAPGPLLKLLSKEPKAIKKRSGGTAANSSEVEKIIAALTYIDPDLDYPDWIGMLLALHSMRDESTYLPIADAWSSLGGKYEATGPNAVRNKWKTFDKDPMRARRIAIGTLFKFAKDAGWDGKSTGTGPYCSDHGAVNDLSDARREREPYPVPITEILATQFKPLSFVVDNLIPDTGLFILSSNPKVGKTTLCHQLCLALICEVPFLGNLNAKPRRVLFLALEDSPRRIKRRSEEILAAPEFDLRDSDKAFDNLMIETEWPNGPGGIEKLDAWLSANPDTDFVVIDTLAAFRGLGSMSSTKVYQEDYELMKQIKRVADRNESSILILHHNRKAPANSPGESIGGSYGLTGAVDGYMVLECRSFGDSEFLLLAQGREVAPQELALKRENFVFRSLGDACMYTMSVERREILDLLAANPDGLGPMDVASALGRKPGATRKLLKIMHERGLIRKIKRGLYAPL